MDETLYQTLLNDGFRFVSYRPRSEKETRDFLERKLKRKKVYFEPKVLEKVIARLHELNYLDDTKFAQWWVENRSTHRPKGKRALEIELRRKGIEPDLIDDVLRENSELIPEKELALKAVRKKLDTWLKLPLLERKKKIYGFLGRRGFNGATIEAIIDAVGSFGVK